VQPSADGRLDLVAARVGDRTRLTDLRWAPPLQALRAHHLDPALPDMAFVIVASPCGGVLQGDRLALSARVEAGARLHLDTSSATRLYRMPDRDARSDVRLEVGADACLELVPDPYLPYAGARFAQETRATVHPRGILLLSEVVAGGRAAGGETLRYARFESLVEARRPDGTLLFRDATCLEPATGNPEMPGLLGPARPVLGTLHVVAAGFGADMLAAALEPVPPGAYCGASALPNGAGAWMRVLAPDVAIAASLIDAGWRAARMTLLGAAAPRSRRY
jgi:urease accessory protein